MNTRTRHRPNYRQSDARTERSTMPPAISAAAIRAMIPPAPPGGSFPPPTRTADDDSLRWVHSLARLILEYQSGFRPRRQLQPFIDPRPLDRITARRSHHIQPAPEVLKARAQPGARNWEVSISYRQNGRVWALAWQMYRRAGNWRVSQIEFDPT